MSVPMKVVLLLIGMFVVAYALQKLFPPTAKDYERQEKEIQAKMAAYETEVKRREQAAAAGRAKNKAKKAKKQQ